MTGEEQAALKAAMDVLDRHIAALNAGDEAALAATLHFPHYRLSQGRLQVWDGPARYFADFRARAGPSQTCNRPCERR